MTRTPTLTGSTYCMSIVSCATETIRSVVETVKSSPAGAAGGPLGSGGKLVLSVVRGTIIRPTAKDSTDAAMPKAMLCRSLLMRLILPPFKECKTVPDEQEGKQRAFRVAWTERTF